MKNYFLAIASFLLFTATTSFAAEPSHVPSSVVKKLNRQFNNPENAQWKIDAQFYKATFIAEGMVLQAFYNTEGNYMGVSRNITKEQLPLNLLLGLDKIEKPITITDLFELNSDRGTEYFISYSDGRKVTTLKGSTEGWNNFIPKG